MTDTSIYDTASWMRRALEAERQLAFQQALYGKTNLWKGECGHVWPVDDDLSRECPICAAEGDRDRAVYALDESRKAHGKTLERLSEVEDLVQNWKCPSCGGRGEYFQRSRGAGAGYVDCTVCKNTGLHPTAIRILRPER